MKEKQEKRNQYESGLSVKVSLFIQSKQWRTFLLL